MTSVEEAGDRFCIFFFFSFNYCLDEFAQMCYVIDVAINTFR